MKKLKSPKNVLKFPVASEDQASSPTEVVRNIRISLEKDDWAELKWAASARGISLDKYIEYLAWNSM
jgi:hypothetical protein